MAEIGIVIVTYNSAAEIGPCVDAALAGGKRLLDAVGAVHRDGVELERADLRAERKAAGGQLVGPVHVPLDPGRNLLLHRFLRFPDRRTGGGSKVRPKAASRGVIDTRVVPPNL